MENETRVLLLYRVNRVNPVGANGCACCATTPPITSESCPLPVSNCIPCAYPGMTAVTAQSAVSRILPKMYSFCSLEQETGLPNPSQSTRPYESWDGHCSSFLLKAFEQLLIWPCTAWLQQLVWHLRTYIPASVKACKFMPC